LIKRDIAILFAQGRVGVVDAALVRWLTRQRVQVNYLAACVTESVFEPLVPKGHIEDILAALEPVDEVLRGNVDLSRILYRHRVTPKSVKTLFWPEAELLDYSITRICKRLTTCEEKAAITGKLTTLDDLRERYGPTSRQRREAVGLVSGSFDLVHAGHVRLIQAAKQRVDVLVALIMSAVSIQQQEKNRLGDRPIYDEGDRVEVLSALRSVDRLVMFNDRDCRPSLRVFCPDYFIKSADDQSRPVVQAEAALVESLGGKTIYLADRHSGCSSTDIIRYVRQQEARLSQGQRRYHSG
jgi:rfaE bifunctional protein nucleotidyltransferase chain/domain